MISLLFQAPPFDPAAGRKEQNMKNQPPIDKTELMIAIVVSVVVSILGTLYLLANLT